MGIRSHTLFTTITERGEGEAQIGERVVSATTEPGKPVSPVYVRQMVARYATRAGIGKAVHRTHTAAHGGHGVAPGGVQPAGGAETPRA